MGGFGGRGGGGGRGVGGLREFRGLMSLVLGIEGVLLVGEIYRMDRFGRREDLGR